MWQRNLIIHYSFFFFNSLKKIGSFINFKALINHYSFFFAHYSLFMIKKMPLFTNHYTSSRPQALFKELSWPGTLTIQSRVCPQQSILLFWTHVPCDVIIKRKIIP